MIRGGRRAWRAAAHLLLTQGFVLCVCVCAVLYSMAFSFLLLCYASSGGNKGCTHGPYNSPPPSPTCSFSQGSTRPRGALFLPSGGSHLLHTHMQGGGELSMLACLHSPPFLFCCLPMTPHPATTGTYCTIYEVGICTLELLHCLLHTLITYWLYNTGG